jgi:hypothetical protein
MVQAIDFEKALQRFESEGGFPGDLLTKQEGERDYVGSTLGIAGTLFFEGAHTPGVREAICQCFEEYEAVAKEHLNWLWRAEPPEGPDCIAYPKAKPMRAMMRRLVENDLVSFGYSSGKKKEDAGAWTFEVNGWRGWQSKMSNRGLDSLYFSMPALYVKENPLAFQAMFVSFARRLRAVHGYGGPALVLSLVRVGENEPFEAYVSERLKGIDVGNAVAVSRKVVEGIKTVSWLTAINYDMVKQIGGMDAVRSELPMTWFAMYDYGGGMVIQAGPLAHAAGVQTDPKPSTYVLPNRLLKGLRATGIRNLHRSSQDGELRINGRAAEDWMQRFDVPESDLLAYKAKLLTEPKLSEETTLPDRL